MKYIVVREFYQYDCPCNWSEFFTIELNSEHELFVELFNRYGRIDTKEKSDLYEYSFKTVESFENINVSNGELKKTYNMKDILKLIKEKAS